MLKITGSILILTATILLGETGANALREQYRQIGQLRRLICMIQSEIRYARSTLEEIFRRAAVTEKEPYRTWLTELSDNMHIHRDMTFAKLWETSVREHLRTSRIPEEELLRLGSLGMELGAPDIRIQEKVLEQYLSQLSVVMEETRESMKTKVRLYHCLGVMSGLLIITLML